LIATGASLGGILIGIFLCYRYRQELKLFVTLPIGKISTGLSANGFYVDRSFHKIFVRGFQKISRTLSPEWVDAFYNRLVALCRGGHQIAGASQSGRVRWYAVGFALGAILISAGVLWL